MKKKPTANQQIKRFFTSSKMNFFRMFIGTLLLLAGLGCCFYLCIFLYAGWKNVQEQQSLSAQFYGISTAADAAMAHSDSAAQSMPSADYSASIKELQEQNPDTIGWLEIPDTTIRYPIVQTTDNTYYLEHSFFGKKDPHGAVFLDTAVDRDAAYPNFILYGHHMKDRTMFAALDAYKDEEYCKSHRDITFITEKGIAEQYQVFSVFFWDSEGTNFDFAGMTQYKDEKSWKDYIENAVQQNIHKDILDNVSMDGLSDNLISIPTKLITLVTCDYRTDDSRLVIIGYQKE